MNKHFFELPKAVKRAVLAALMAEWATKKEVGAAVGRVYLFFRVNYFLAELFAGAAVVHVGRCKTIAGHSFPCGVHNVPRHTFPRMGGGGCQIFFYFFWDSN